VKPPLPWPLILLPLLCLFTSAAVSSEASNPTPKTAFAPARVIQKIESGETGRIAILASTAFSATEVRDRLLEELSSRYPKKNFSVSDILPPPHASRKKLVFDETFTRLLNERPDLLLVELSLENALPAADINIALHRTMLNRIAEFVADNLPDCELWLATSNPVYLPENHQYHRPQLDGYYAATRVRANALRLKLIDLENDWLPIQKRGASTLKRFLPTSDRPSPDGINHLVIPRLLAALGARNDLVIYGSTPSGLIAAQQAARLKASTLVCGADQSIGGMMSNGLSVPDTGKMPESIAGLTRTFFESIDNHYRTSAAWRWQPKDDFWNAPTQPDTRAPNADSIWTVEPHVAELLFERVISENNLSVLRSSPLDETLPILKQNNRILALRTTNGEILRGDMFIDASYEGDLLAAANVEHSPIREANTKYNESINGVRVSYNTSQFPVNPGINGFLNPTHPSSPLLPSVLPPRNTEGTEDPYLQASCFRPSLSSNPANRIPFERPADYNPNDFELIARFCNATSDPQKLQRLFSPTSLPNSKADVSQQAAVGTNLPNGNLHYAAMSRAQRKAIAEKHERYLRGLLFFLSNDPRIPINLRETVGKWGLAADEFQGNRNWPELLYVREARRMVGAYVLTEKDISQERRADNVVLINNYGNINNHHSTIRITKDGEVEAEGATFTNIRKGLHIPYQALTPQPHQAANLLVPVCHSASHVAFGATRFEPTFMALGQVAATAAILAQRLNLSVQELPYETLREKISDLIKEPLNAP
jgi:hypothetical protein